MISLLILKAKINPNFLNEIHAKRDEWIAKEKVIGRVVDQLILEDAFIDSCHQVVDQVNLESSILVKEYEVRKVMNQKGMRYKKIKHVPLTANTEKNMILRQRWAMAVLDKDHKSKVYLNIDETWLGMSDFRRMKW